jgi:hypothetical protein
MAQDWTTIPVCIRVFAKIQMFISLDILKGKESIGLLRFEVLSTLVMHEKITFYTEHTDQYAEIYFRVNQNLKNM